MFMADAAPCAGTINCKICDRGALILKRKFRMSTPVVVIGFLLLVPSVSLILFLAAVFVVAAITQAPRATALVGAFELLLGIGAFISGLLGWLLVMKKRVLQCSTCGAVVNAS